MSSQWTRVRDVARGLIQNASDQLLDDLARYPTTSIWERAHNELTDSFQRLTASLDIGNTGTCASASGGTSGEDPENPLHWYGSLDTHSTTFRTIDLSSPIDQLSDMFSAPGGDGHEIQITVDFHQEDGKLRYSSSFSADRHKLRDGPTGVIAAPHGAIGSYGRIKSALAEIGEFVASCGPMITEQFNRR